MGEVRKVRKKLEERMEYSEDKLEKSETFSDIFRTSPELSSDFSNFSDFIF